MLVEACVDSVESAIAAERGGAGRLELCDNLYDAGTTPSAGMIAAVKAAVRIPVFVIVRPRGGGFVYSAAELDVMRRDVQVARELGADGIVIGALTRDGAIDELATGRLVDASANLPVTFHRAFDVVADQRAAFDRLMALGVARVLTSGGAPSALAGVAAIAALVRQSAGRIAVMAGGGVREENVADIVRRTGVSEVHVRPTRVVTTTGARSHGAITFRKAMPVDESAWEEIDESRIREIARRAE